MFKIIVSFAALVALAKAGGPIGYGGHYAVSLLKFSVLEIKFF
jgi:hypothetical protein